MRFKKRTRFLSMVMAVAMCLSLSATAFAVEDTTKVDNMVVVATDEANSLMVLANSQEIVDFGGKPLRGTHHAYVCPPKGATLKMSVNNAITSDTSEVKVETTKNGGWWPSNTTNVARGQGSKTYTLISSYNGETYDVKFTASNGYFVAILYW